MPDKKCDNSNVLKSFESFELNFCELCHKLDNNFYDSKKI